MDLMELFNVSGQAQQTMSSTSLVQTDQQI